VVGAYVFDFLLSLHALLLSEARHIKLAQGNPAIFSPAHAICSFTVIGPGAHHEPYFLCMTGCILHYWRIIFPRLYAAFSFFGTAFLVIVMALFSSIILSYFTQAGQVIVASPVIFVLAVWSLAHRKSGGFDL